MVFFLHGARSICYTFFDIANFVHGVDLGFFSYEKEEAWGLSLPSANFCGGDWGADKIHLLYFFCMF